MSAKSEIWIRPRSVMEVPSTQALSRVYADAFLAAANGVGVGAALSEYRSFLDEVVEKFPELRRLLGSAIMNRDEKVKIVSRISEGRCSEFFANFLKVLARHDRLDLLSTIYQESERRFETESGKRRVQVRSAVSLTPEMQARIVDSLQTRLGFQPLLEVHVDPALLGGLVIRIGDTVYDSSLRTRLKQLRARFSQRKLHEIQSGRDRFSHPA